MKFPVVVAKLSARNLGIILFLGRLCSRDEKKQSSSSRMGKS
jgi:hypothetical protein